jgi:hypothetical protein
MFDKFPPPIRATIEAFFKDPLLGVAADDHIGELATELELQYPDLSVADAEKIAREAVAERSGTSSHFIRGPLGNLSQLRPRLPLPSS